MKPLCFLDGGSAGLCSAGVFAGYYYAAGRATVIFDSIERQPHRIHSSYQACSATRRLAPYAHGTRGGQRRNGGPRPGRPARGLLRRDIDAALPLDTHPGVRLGDDGEGATAAISAGAVIAALMRKRRTRVRRFAIPPSRAGFHRYPFCWRFRGLFLRAPVSGPSEAQRHRRGFSPPEQPVRGSGRR